MKKTIKPKILRQTRLLGIKISKKIKTGRYFGIFFGNLGKRLKPLYTRFGLGLNVKRRIISPTFIIVRHYKLEKGNFLPYRFIPEPQNVNDLLSVVWARSSAITKI